MNRSVYVVRFFIIVSSLVDLFGIASPGADYRLVNDGRGTPKLVAKATSFPLSGSFWLHLFAGDNQRNDAQLSLASVSVNGDVKTCVVNLKSTHSNLTDDWYFIKWHLQSNEFSCVLLSLDQANVSSAPVSFATNGSSLLSSSLYTISPGGGNSDYCLLNFTVGSTQLLNCTRVKKPSAISTTTGNEPCDCPPPPKGSVFSQNAVDFAANDEEKPFLRSNTVLATEGQERWSNSSSLQREFPTPKPFDVNSLKERTAASTTASTITSTTMTKRTTAATTKLEHVVSHSDRPGTTSVSSSTVSSSTASVASSGSCGGKVCENSGICVRNSTHPQLYHCNCSVGFYGDFCQYNYSANGSARNPVHSPPVQQSSQQSSCPDSYCENRGSCRPAIVGIGNDTLRPSGGVPNFTCICEEGYVGRTCSYWNVCHWDPPCQNDGYCSVIVPLDENGGKGAANASFRCHCQRGYDGDRCQINLSTTSTLSTISTAGPAIISNWTGGNKTRCSAEEAALCKNGATCAILNRSALCNCTANFTGQYCDQATGGGGGGTESNTISKSEINIGAIVGGVVGGLAFIGLIIGSIFLYRCIQRSRKLKGKYNPAREEMTATGAQTLTMATVTTGERLI